MHDAFEIWPGKKPWRMKGGAAGAEEVQSDGFRALD